MELYFQGGVQKVRGMIDTGNGLRDPVSGLPVSIIDRRTADKLLHGEITVGIRYIPYQTIGKKEGVLPIFRIDELRIYGEKECHIDAPLIAISEEEISAGGEYEMILNPNLF